MGLYFGKAQPGSGYGAAGSIYFNSVMGFLLLNAGFFGAEITQSYAELKGGNIQPDENANKLTEETKYTHKYFHSTRC